MFSLSSRFSRANHFVFVFGIVCLATILAGIKFNQTLGFTATAAEATSFTISGQVTENGSGLAGVTMTLAGSQQDTQVTDSNGSYSFEVAGGGNYTVTPSATGFQFDPPNLTVNNLSTSRIGNFAANRQSFVVTNTNDHGAGSLREAITTANATLGPDTIVFNIPGPGVKSIKLLTPLPEITGGVLIDASTQPGYAGAPLVELDGANIPVENGLVVTSGHTTIRGLAIGNFQGSAIVLQSCDNNVIQGNYLGVDTTGTVARPNNTGILLSNSSNNVIGGMSAGARNVISGNVNGIEVLGASNVIQGNFIGTNAAGTAGLGNRERGINIPGGPSFANNVIGSGNLISGNSTGIFILSNGNTIQGNLIGTDITGTHKIGNEVGIEAEATNTLIGGLTPAARNIISGNGTGVVIGQLGSTLQGNFIGTDITGTFALGNAFEGVIADHGATIGGTVPEARNVISANGVSNVSLGINEFVLRNPNIVRGNYIGTDVTGTRTLTDPVLSTTNSGIFVFSANNVIGGSFPGAQNVISGNAVGIRLKMTNVPAGAPRGNVIEGNVIGLNAAGTGPLPNTQGGIELSDALDNFIGGTRSGAANKIAFNGGPGVIVLSNSSGNAIRGNSIFSNAALGIDLGNNGVTANDLTDSDTGANNLQNFPLITAVSSVGANTRIQGSLSSTPNTTFQIDFYSSAALDPSGNGEGALFLSTTAVTTDSNGNATIDVTFPALLATDRVVTATATDPNGNTSEFSSGDASSAAGNLQFSMSSIRIIEDLGVATVTILRKGGSSGTLTVDYATIDGTATAGQDYTSTSGTLTFGSGETSKNIQIPISDDAITEVDETFTVVLRNASSLEALGVPDTLAVTIQDRSTVPFISANAASVVEGNAGSTTQALFTFNLSAATGRSVTVNYATQNLTAFGGSSCSNSGTDYETISGTISFQPGNTSVSVPVTICGDNSAEPAETFRINLSGASNGEVSFPQPAGTIIDDDALELLLDDSGPTVNQAAALDALFQLRDPFHVALPEWWPAGADRNTRVMFFVRGLQLDPGEPASAVIVQLTGNNQLFAVPAEDVRAIPDVEFTQVVIRLPDNLAEATYTTTIVAHSRTSNAGSFRIAK